MGGAAPERRVSLPAARRLLPGLIRGGSSITSRCFRREPREARPPAWYRATAKLGAELGAAYHADQGRSTGVDEAAVVRSGPSRRKETAMSAHGRRDGR